MLVPIIASSLAGGPTYLASFTHIMDFRKARVALVRAVSVFGNLFLGVTHVTSAAVEGAMIQRVAYPEKSA